MRFFGGLRNFIGRGGLHNLNALMRLCTLLFLSFLAAIQAPAQGKLRELLTGRPPEGFTERSWTVDGVKRTALVRVPADPKAPEAVVFCWHGHGGNSAQSVRGWAFDKADPTSILIYPQGLPTVSPLVDKEGRRSGWQSAVGDGGDRDIKLFDAILADLKKERSVNERRIYSMGHSNGAAFSYVLWQARPDVLAAIGSVAGSLTIKARDLKPLPVIHVAGENDDGFPSGRSIRDPVRVRAGEIHRYNPSAMLQNALDCRTPNT